MTRLAFRMRLKPGTIADYRARHDAIWPELVEVLRNAGISDYSIFVDERDLSLFAVLQLAPDNRRDLLPDDPVMQRWWESMAPLMEVGADNRPLEWSLVPVFHLD